ncbi:DNA polymerase III subunit gamma/tau [Collinsella tanakaei]|uniref:DNA polymerase III subunit gamma/tau n=1 Tax=Collinsella tanakaei TaxID=626935 RepID=UPI001F193EF4|nr:DNA polymerase III subunit gamma/tau [Collinsella tanakaei]MCF2622327.1 DNA polymerase III subunit gamma/tau [Collinsella tanakaei]
MESLYRKYRPLTFDSVVGQQHIVSTLEHAVTEGRLSHAYLFCGPRGTGKTTMARILAKALLCEHADAARAQGASGCMPDGTCPECEAIAEGTHPDVYELDAASRTGVDNVREEIISSVSFAPVRGAYKVYIIDEVHMLTAAAFNALLKTLEEPPSHVVFILCTTDPQKILETILSRCQRFDFHRISNDDIVGRLRYICEQEHFDADDEALEIVARHARGGMRDALSTLEQLSVFGDGAIRVSDARSLLGEVSGTVLGEFSRAIAARDVVSLFGAIRTQVDEGNDLLELARDLVAHMRDVYTACVAGGNPELFDGTPDEVAALVDEASAFEGAQRLARVLTVLDDAVIEMRGASDPRLVLEIACTRLARPESDLTLEALAERLDRLEAQIAAGVPSAPLDAAGVAALTGTKPRPAGQRVAGQAGSRVEATGRAGAAAHDDDLPWNVPAGARARSGGGAAAPAAAASAAAPGVATSPAAQGGSAASVRPAPEPEVKAAASVAPAAAAGVRPATADAAPARPRAAAPEAARESASAPTSADAVHADGGAARSAEDRSEAGAEHADVPAASPSARREAPSAAEVAAAAAPATPAVTDAGELQRKWTEVVKRVTAAQASRGALLQSSRAQADDGSRLVVGFPKGSNFAIKMLGRPDSHELIMPIVCSVFGSRVVEYVMDGGSPRPASGSGGTGAADAAPAVAVPATSPAAAPAEPPAPVASAGPAVEPVDAPAPAQASVPATHDAHVVDDSQADPAPRQARSQVAAPAPSQVASPASPQVVQGAPASSPALSALAAAPHSESAEHPQVDHTSGPTVVPEPDIDADRRAWEDEQVPYDDATIADLTGEDLPPLDLPQGMASAMPALAPAPTREAAMPAQAPAPTEPAASGASSVSKPASPSAPVPSAQAAAPASVSPSAASKSAAATPAGAAPWVGAPTPAADETQVPQSEEEAKAMLNSIFGNVVFKDA